jgi:glycine/D-amino acid oxidase-like deaminating enzyme/nitrite reductase/ring-hydroxylating ferredoxin subunit
MKKQSIWKASGEPLHLPSLSEHTTADTVIVGGGITGILTACLLAREGRDVAVLEAHRIGESTTGNSTGNLYAMVDERFYKLDKEDAKGVAQSRTEAMTLIESLIREHSLNCDFRRLPWHLFSEKDEKDPELEKEKEALREAGLKVHSERDIIPFDVKAAIVVENQAQFNPLLFVQQLAGKIQGKGCRIYEHSQVLKIEDGKTCTVHTDKGSIQARNVVLATHTPKGLLMVQTLLGPYREYGIAAKLKGSYPREGIYWSTDQPQYSIRTYSRDGEKYLIVIGENHKTGQEENTESCYSKVEEYARQHFEVESIGYRWSAQGYNPADGRPYIGPCSLGDNVYIATGYAANGLTYSAVAARLITDRITGRENPWKDLYDSRRFTPLASAKDFIKENLNVAAEYLKNLPFRADAAHFSEVKPGEGKTMEIDGEKYAVYRSPRNKLHVVSAVCPHLKCIVTWNGAETTWDCPCHGSRFTAEGMVLEGPALHNLQPRKED